MVVEFFVQFGAPRSHLRREPNGARVAEMALAIDIFAGQKPMDIPRYTLPEAAHHLCLPTATVRSWIVGRHYPSSRGLKKSKPIIAPADAKTSLLSFANLAEVH